MKSSDTSALERALAFRYSKLRRLHSSVGAECYLAADVRTEGLVFLKVVSNTRYIRESNAFGVRGHSNLALPIDTIYVDRDHCVLVYPYFAFGSLRDLLRKKGKLEIDAVIELAEQLLAALDLVHAHGLIHGDLKPENILIDAEEGEKYSFLLADFGSSATIAELKDRNWRASSPAYEAPESISGKPQISSDLYSVGVLLYEALTGNPPFSGMPREIYSQALYLLPSTAQIANGRLRLLIVSLLQKQPKKRPSSAKKALSILKTVSTAIYPHLPRQTQALVPGLSLSGANTPSGQFEWVGCDHKAHFIAFARENTISVFDKQHRYCGQVDWSGAIPRWHETELWYEIGSDLYRWDLSSGRKSYAGNLGSVPEGYDLDNDSVAWVMHGHLAVGRHDVGLARPRMKSLQGYIVSGLVRLIDNKVLVVSGYTGNELTAFSGTLEELWSINMGGTITDVAAQHDGSSLVLIRHYEDLNDWRLAATKEEKNILEIKLPRSTTRLALSSIGAIAWTGSGVVSYQWTPSGFVISKWPLAKDKKASTSGLEKAH